MYVNIKDLVKYDCSDEEIELKSEHNALIDINDNIRNKNNIDNRQLFISKSMCY